MIILGLYGQEMNEQSPPTERNRERGEERQRDKDRDRNRDREEEPRSDNCQLNFRNYHLEHLPGYIKPMQRRRSTYKCEYHF